MVGWIIKKHNVTNQTCWLSPWINPLCVSWWPKGETYFICYFLTLKSPQGELDSQQSKNCWKPKTTQMCRETVEAYFCLLSTAILLLLSYGFISWPSIFLLRYSDYRGLQDICGILCGSNFGMWLNFWGGNMVFKASLYRLISVGNPTAWRNL